MSVGSFLSKLGKDFEKGLSVLEPIAQVAAPVIAIAAPGIAPVYSLVQNVVVATEQKFAAMGKQTGTGPQKMQEVLQILEAPLQYLLPSFGVPNPTTANIEAYIQSVVDGLNALPGTPVPAPSQPAV